MTRAPVLPTLLLLDALLASTACGPASQPLFPPFVSVATIVHDPKRWEGQKIGAEGFLSCDRRDCWLFLHEDDAKFGNVANAVDIDERRVPVEIGPDLLSAFQHHVTIYGVYHVDPKGRAVFHAIDGVSEALDRVERRQRLRR